MKRQIFAHALLFSMIPFCAYAQDATGVTTTIENTEAAIAEDSLATPDQRIAVNPLDWNVTRGDGQRTNSIQELESVDPSTNPVGSSVAGKPQPGADSEAQKLFPQEWEGLQKLNSLEQLDDDDQSVLGTKDVFTQYCENCSALNPNYPQVAIGKLFTTSGTCSASVVSPNNVIVTAAHCCYNRSAGKWIGGWRFAPAYRDGFAPFGLFNWASATVLNRWINTGDRQSDVCLIKLANNAQGNPVTRFTGWLGRSWNFGTIQVHHAVGYPGNIGSGNKKELCVSESFSPSSGCGGATVLNTGCSMTFGASGGPWIRSYRNGNWVNSVVSGYDSSSCTGSFGMTFNGPRFTTGNIVTLCNAIGC